jgi:hypothetical protein
MTKDLVFRKGSIFIFGKREPFAWRKAFTSFHSFRMTLVLSGRNELRPNNPHQTVAAWELPNFNVSFDERIWSAEALLRQRTLSET